MKNTRILVFVGLFISIDVILTRFLAFQTPIIRISFGFLPIALSGIMFGPIIGGITAMASDIIGMIIAPKGAFIPGFTISAFLTGAIYGFFLHNKKRSILRILITVLVITIFVDSTLNTIWLIIAKFGNAGIILPRLLKNLIMVPIQTIVINIGWRYLGSYIEKDALRKTGF
jgi:ECF transporter S component (folate family)